MLGLLTHQSIEMENDLYSVNTYVRVIKGHSQCRIASECVDLLDAFIIR